MREGSIGGLRLSFRNGGELFDSIDPFRGLLFNEGSHVFFTSNQCSRYLVPSVVTVTSESEKLLVDLSRCSGFVTIMVFSALGK
jgi:hypothetical protein